MSLMRILSLPVIAKLVCVTARKERDLKQVWAQADADTDETAADCLQQQTLHNVKTAGQARETSQTAASPVRP
jgi:hypothetical protein